MAVRVRASPLSGVLSRLLGTRTNNRGVLTLATTPSRHLIKRILQRGDLDIAITGGTLNSFWMRLRGAGFLGWSALGSGFWNTALILVGYGLTPSRYPS